MKGRKKRELKTPTKEAVQDWVRENQKQAQRQHSFLAQYGNVQPLVSFCGAPTASYHAASSIK